MPGITAKLSEAIDSLYDVFADYPRPPWFEGCECCWGRDDSVPADVVGHRGVARVPAPGGTRPVRELTAYELCRIAAEVPLTAGTLDLLKHYLPRILEVAAEGAFEWPDLEVVLSRLNNDERLGSTPWTEWPTTETAGIRDFLHAPGGRGWPTTEATTPSILPCAGSGRSIRTSTGTSTSGCASRAPMQP